MCWSHKGGGSICQQPGFTLTMACSLSRKFPTRHKPCTFAPRCVNGFALWARMGRVEWDWVSASHGWQILRKKCVTKFVIAVWPWLLARYRWLCHRQLARVSEKAVRGSAVAWLGECIYIYSVYITKSSLGYLSSMYFSTQNVLVGARGFFPEIEAGMNRICT